MSAKQVSVMLFIKGYAILLASAHIIISFFPAARSWGIHQWSFYPLYTSAGLFGISMLIGIDKVRAYMAAAAARVAQPFLALYHKSGTNLSFAIISLCSLLPFWLLRVKSFFLGDGYLIIRQAAHNKARLADIFTGHHLGTYLHYEPLEIISRLVLMNLAGLDGTTGATAVYAFTSMAAGAIYIYISLHLSNRLGADSIQKVVSFGMLSSIGTMQLFFGYIEHYSFVTVGILAYVYFSLKYLDKKCTIILPAVSMFFAIGSHLLAVAIVPSFIFLLIKPGSVSALSFRRRMKIAVLSLVLIILVFFAFPVIPRFITGTFFGSSSPLLPFYSASPDHPYTMFSAAHLLDIFNGLLLTTPFGLLVVPLALYFDKSSFKIPSVSFLAVTSFSLFALLFIIDPHLGSRDWDLLSLYSAPLTVLSVVLLFKMVQTTDKLVSAGVMIISISLLFTIPWVVINAKPDLALARYENLLSSNSIQSKYYAYDDLAKYYWNMGNYVKAKEAYAAALKHSPYNVRLYNSLGLTYLKLDDIDNAENTFLQGLALDPMDEELMKSLLKIYFDKQQYSMVIKTAIKYLEMNNASFSVAYILGFTYVKINRLDNALRVLHEVVGMNPRFREAYQLIYDIYKHQHKPDKLKEIRTLMLSHNLAPPR